MPIGSCLCGTVKYEYTGEHLKNATCHCLSCRKISGSSNTVNFMVPTDKFRITSGSPKQYSATHENGMQLTVSFCGNCGTALYKEADADAFKGVVIVQAGTLDDLNGLESAQPGDELYVKYRASWIPTVATAKQNQEFV